MQLLSLSRMHRYFIKTPWLVKKLFPDYIWCMPAEQNEVYLTFDDGPHPVITPWVLDLLATYEYHASFFCIGKNVVQYPEIYQRILNEGHAVGNHTFHHLNGWKTEESVYLDDVRKAATVIQTNLFRPPYGRISRKQANGIANAMDNDAKLVMWDVLSGDFDTAISGEQCFRNVVQHIRPGSVVVFHDSDKAYRNLKTALPGVLHYLKELNYQCKKIELAGVGTSLHN